MTTMHSATCVECGLKITAPYDVVFPADGQSWIFAPGYGHLCPVCRVKLHGTTKRLESA